MRKNQSGYTLLELLLYIAISGSLLLVISSFFGLTITSRSKYQAINDVNQEAYAAIAYINRTTRNASAISSPAAGTTSTALDIASESPNPATTSFSVDNGRLRVKTGNDPYVFLTNETVEVTNFSVQNLSRPSTPGTVRVSFTMKRKTSLQAKKYQFENNFITSASLRRQE